MNEARPEIIIKLIRPNYLRGIKDRAHSLIKATACANPLRRQLSFFEYKHVNNLMNDFSRA